MSILDVAVDGLDLDMRIELARRLTRDLEVSRDGGATCDGLRSLNMLLLEEELTIEVAEVDRIVQRVSADRCVGDV